MCSGEVVVVLVLLQRTSLFAEKRNISSERRVRTASVLGVSQPEPCRRVRTAATARFVLSSSAESASPIEPAEERPSPPRQESQPTVLDVEMIHRIFKLRDVHVGEFVRGVAAAAANEKVSWMSFLSYMCGLADVEQLREGSCAAATMARKIFNVFAEEQQQEVELRELASGLSVRRKGFGSLHAPHLQQLDEACFKQHG